MAEPWIIDLRIGFWHPCAVAENEGELTERTYYKTGKAAVHWWEGECACCGLTIKTIEYPLDLTLPMLLAERQAATGGQGDG